MQVWNDDDEPDECLAMVIRTGDNATVGEMMRSVFHRQWSWEQLRTPMGFQMKVLALSHAATALDSWHAPLYLPFAADTVGLVLACLGMQLLMAHTFTL